MSHDYDWKAKLDSDKKHWPQGSLERTLLRIGVKTLQEAVSRARAEKVAEKVAEANPESSAPVKSDVEAIQACIKELEIITKEFDFKNMFQDTRERLGAMPLNSKEEAELWLSEWKKILKPYVW